MEDQPRNSAHDVGAICVNAKMELAAVRAIGAPAQAQQSDIVAMACGECVLHGLSPEAVDG